MRNHNHFMLRLALVAFVGLPISASAADRGEPWRRHTIDNSSRGADGVRLADVNNDGRIDISTAWEEGGKICVYLHPGADSVRLPWPKIVVGSVRSPEDAVFVDVDNDGAVDVVSCSEGKTKTVWVHWGPKQSDEYRDAAKWRTEPIPVTVGKQQWMFCLPMYLHNDNKPTLILGSKGSGAAVGLLQAPANRRDLANYRWQKLYDAGWIMSLRSGDIDRDGDTDILVSDRRGNNRGVLWLKNPGNARGINKWSEHRIGPQNREVMFLDWADINGDGKRELLHATRGDNIFIYAQQSPTEWSEHQIRLPDNVGTGKAVAAGDLDGDESIDVVLSCENAQGKKSGVIWLSHPVRWIDSNWIAHEVSGPDGVKFDRIELIDLDADGDLDILTCEERTNLGVIWYENRLRQR